MKIEIIATLCDKEVLRADFYVDRDNLLEEGQINPSLDLVIKAIREKFPEAK